MLEVAAGAVERSPEAEDVALLNGADEFILGRAGERAGDQRRVDSRERESGIHRRPQRSFGVESEPPPPLDQAVGATGKCRVGRCTFWRTLLVRIGTTVPDKPESRALGEKQHEKPGESRSSEMTALWAGGITLALATPALLITGCVGRSEPTAAGAQPVASCSVDSLATLGGPFGSVTAANRQGTAVGTATDETGASHAVLWRSGEPEQLVTGTTSAIAVAINGRGDVIGTGQADGMAVGWVWIGGATTRLKAGVDRVAVPSAINDRGVIVGALSESEGTEGATGHEDEHEQAVFWDSAGSEPRTLTPLAGDDGALALAVDNRNRVGGVSHGRRFAPVIWDAAGEPRALPTLGGDYGVVRALSDSGLAAGDAVAADGTNHPVMWDADGRITGLALPAGARSGRARAILAGDVIVGTADVPAAGGGFQTRAVQWSNPREPRLLPAAHGGAATANGGADDVTYVGNSTDRLGGRHPSIWHCRR